MWKLLCVTLALLICAKDSLSQLNVCGRPPLNPRIVGGVDAPEGSWPWMASLHSNGGHFCGGSLINNEWVLTAAHCLIGIDKSDVLVYLGKMSQQGAKTNEITRTIKDIVYHHLPFDQNTYDNDIALLRLSSTVTFTDFIRPVCLAAQNSVFATNTNGWITGWGDVGRNTHLPPPGTLQEATVLVLENSKCDPLCYEKITNNMICAGLRNGGRGHWKGDSGGPMVSRQCSLWVQSGIISWTEDCAMPDKPDGYTRVSQYQQWITDNTGPNLPGFVLFNPPDPCSATSRTSTSCHGRCNEKYNAGNVCNCNAGCKTKCCSDYNQQCMR